MPQITAIIERLSKQLDETISQREALQQEHNIAMRPSM